MIDEGLRDETGEKDIPYYIVAESLVTLFFVTFLAV